MVVAASTDKALQRFVAVGKTVEELAHFNFAQTLWQIIFFFQYQIFGNVLVKVVKALLPAGFEHRADVVFGMWEKFITHNSCFK